MAEPLKVECPTCKTSVAWNDDYPYRPFCSKRCQQSDFCGWANEEHVIGGDQTYDDVFSEQPETNRSIS